MHNKFQALVAASTAGLIVGASAAAHAQAGDGRYFDHHGMMGSGGWFYGPVMMLLFFALLVGAVVLVVRLLGGDNFRSGPKPDDTASAILRERFARGDISQDEYEAAKRVLGGEKT